MKTIIATLVTCLFVTGCLEEETPKTASESEIKAQVKVENERFIKDAKNYRRKQIEPLKPEDFNREPKREKSTAPVSGSQ